MNNQTPSDPVLIKRRTFLIGIAASGAGLAVALLPGKDKLFAFPGGVAGSFVPNVWVMVDPDGTTTITVARSEMGQGVRTSLAMIVAEEMDADWQKVVIRQARPDTGNGSLATGGSGSTTSSYSSLRKAGAAVRSMFITAAAQSWSLPESSCSASNGVVNEINGSRSLSYGQLTDAAAALPVPSNPTLKDPSKFTLIGTRQSHIDAADIVRGKAQFGLDVRIPNMKFAVIAFPPAIGASVQSVDTDALRVPGVIKAAQVSGVPGVVVLADNTYAALQGRDALKIAWNMGPNAALDSATISARLKAAIGSMPDVPAGSATKIDAQYELPYLAHATMEPMNCVADVKSSSADIWCPTQDAGGIRSDVARALGLSESAVVVHTTLLGGGFGRRSQTEYATYAAHASKDFSVPLLLMYTRPDDMKHDFYRPATYHAMKGGLSSDGQVTGWIQKCVPSGMGYNPSYSVNATGVLGGNLSSPVPTGSWRSVSNSTAVFANECFVDELAVAAAKDPYLFRRNLLPAGRLRDVLDEAATRADWTKPLPKGWGRGIACTDAYAYVAHVIEVSVSDSGLLRVERVVIAVDCGIAINPLGVEAQLQGACVDGLSTALKAAVTIEAGAVKQSTYADYEWLRLNEMPTIEVYIVPSTQSPRGMGEAGFPSVSPALCNAIFNATGIRIRTLPISKSFLSDIRSTESNSGADLTIFPNPFSSATDISGHFSNASSNQVSIAVCNLLGSTLYQTSINADADGNFRARIPLESAADAAYLLTVQSGNTMLTRTLVKQ